MILINKCLVSVMGKSMKIIQKMKKLAKYDIQKDSCGKILFSIGFPLLIVNVISIFLSVFMNDLYSRYVGSLYFTVTGAISVVITFSTQGIGSVVSAVWIRNASFYVQREKNDAGRYIVNSFYTVILAGLLLTIISLICTDILLNMLHVPQEIYSETKTYYIVYMSLLVISGVSTFLRTINDGLGNSADIFIGNFTTTFGTFAAAVLLLVWLNTGFAGTPLVSYVSALFVIAVSSICLKRRGFHLLPNKGCIRLSLKMLWGNLCYAFLLSLQFGICTVGDLFVTAQTNKYLSVEYITLTSVSLPISGPMSIMSNACMIFLPHNYKKGNELRIKGFLRLTLGITVLYGMLCFFIYAVGGKWYFASLFEDAHTIAMGQEYWFWYGIGFIFVAVIFVVRYFFDAIGMGKVSLISGIGELLGKLICAFWLIPKYGNIGRTLSYPLGWMFGAVSLLIAYGALRKRIYLKILA